MAFIGVVLCQTFTCDVSELCLFRVSSDTSRTKFKPKMFAKWSKIVIYFIAVLTLAGSVAIFYPLLLHLNFTSVSK